MSAKNFRMPFGKFKNTFLSRIPSYYLIWLLNIKKKEPLEQYTIQEVNRRLEAEKVILYCCDQCACKLSSTQKPCKFCGAPPKSLTKIEKLGE